MKDQLPLPQELQRTVSTNIRAKELKGLEYEVNERRMMMLDPFLIQKFEIIIDDSLGFTIRIFVSVFNLLSEVIVVVRFISVYIFLLRPGLSQIL